MIRKFQNHTPQIPDSCYIFPTATIIGDVVLGENVIAYPGVVIRGERHKVVIGDNTNLQENSTIHMEWDRDCIIGSGVTIGHNAMIHACTICDNVLVGMGAIVQDGAVIGENSRLDYVVADKDTVFDPNRTLMGYQTYPVFVAKGSKV